jgi:hypothetical protein
VNCQEETGRYMNAIRDLNENPKRWQRVHALVEEFIADTGSNSTALPGDEEDSDEEEDSLIAPPSDPVAASSDVERE